MLIWLVGADTDAIVSHIRTWGFPVTRASFEPFHFQGMMGDNLIGMDGGWFEAGLPGDNADVGFYGSWGTPWDYADIHAILDGNI
jgi:hypothetical protein